MTLNVPYMIRKHVNNIHNAEHVSTHTVDNP